jgi:hypothetical protein
VVERKGLHEQGFARGVDRIAQFGQMGDDRGGPGARKAVGLVIEQAPFARGGHFQRLDQRGFVIRLKIDAAGVEAFETISFGHDRV